jgi:hypothetical protein
VLTENLIGFGTCSNPAVGKEGRAKTAYFSDLLLKGGRTGAFIFVGEEFGCVHWEPKPGLENDQETGKDRITPKELKQIMLRNKNMKPADLARKLNIRVQRVSDWIHGRRKVPPMAVVAMAAMGLM